MLEADAFVSASRHETFGIVLAEAIAAEVPTIATATGGARFVLDGTGATLVPVGDAPALAEAMAVAIGGHVGREASAHDRGIIERRFGRAAIVEQIGSIYRELGVIGA